MIEIEITDPMLLRARKKAKELGRLSRSITRGQGNLAGFVGEEIALKVLGGRFDNIEKNIDYDIIIPSGKTVDVKTIDGNEDTVFNVHWRLTGTDDANNSSGVYGTQELDTSDLSSFTAFADLTNEQITGWVESAMGEDKVTEIKANISNQIAELVTPTQETKTIGE